MMTCAYCTINPTIENSHIIPAFVVRHIKANSPGGFLLNSWDYKKLQDGLKGPYLCAQCDNVLFSGWENHFKKAVFDPVQNGQFARWADEDSIRFVLSVVFRYMTHFLETAPSKANRQMNTRFRDLTKKALGDLAILDSKLFLYPYQYRPIVNNCHFMPGVNHFLQLGFNCLRLCAEGALPEAVALFLPSIILLATADDLAAVNDRDLPNPISLSVSNAVDFGNANLTMSQFLRGPINQAVGETTGHQKGIGLWRQINYVKDKLANPQRQLYRAQELDSRLQIWQRKHCRRQSEELHRNKSNL
jgi:hypothetical protein